jgi:hypothetical protein
MRRAIAAIAAASFIFVAFAATASAAPSGICNRTRGVPGDRLVVQGENAIAGESAFLNFNGKVIGGSTVDGYDNFKVAGRVPRSMLPGTYPVTVTFTPSNTVATPCSFRVVRRRR